MVPPSERLDRRWMAGCVLLAVAVRFFRIGHQSLWIDETISLQLATWASGAEFWKGLLRDIHGPWGSLLLHGWVRLGHGEAWLRTLYAIPAVATVPLVYVLGHDLFGRRAGRIAGLAAAVSPFHVWYSQEVRNYAWAILFVTGALVLFLRAWDARGGARTWVGVGICLALAALSSFSAALLFVALAVVAVARRPFEPRFVAAAGATLAAAGLVFVPWFVDWFARLDATRLWAAAPPPMGVDLREASDVSLLDVPYALWTLAFGYSLGPSLLDLHLDRSAAALTRHVPVLALGAFTVASAGVLGLRAAVERGRAAWIAGIVGVPLLLAALLAVRDVKTFHPRYLITFFPVLVALLAAGWARGTRIARAGGLVALALAALSLGNLYFDPRYAKEDSRSAARFLLERERPGDAVVVIYSFRPFRYYFADTAPGAARLLNVHKRFLRTDDQIRTHVADARKGSARVWLVLSRWWDVAPEARLRGLFEESLRETELREFHGVKVLLYEEKTA